MSPIMPMRLRGLTAPLLAMLLLLAACAPAAAPSPTTAPAKPGAQPTAAPTSAPVAKPTMAPSAAPTTAPVPSPAAAAKPAARPAASPVSARPGGPSPTGVPAGMGSAEPDGVFPRTITHFGGTTSVPAEPKRVIVIATGQLDSVLTLGRVPIGAAAGAGAAIVPNYVTAEFPRSAPQLQQITPVGSRLEPDLEALAGLKPDLILANKAGSGKIYSRLSTIAPTVLTEGTGVNWKQDFLLIAAAIGQSGTAERFLADYYAKAARLAQAVSANPPSISLVRFNPGRTRIFGIPSFAGSIAYDAGLARPRSQQFDATSQDLSPEQVARMDGDWIFYSIQGPAEKTDAAGVLGGPLWNGLAAVKANRAIEVDDDPWYLNAGPTAAMVVLRALGRVSNGS